MSSIQSSLVANLLPSLLSTVSQSGSPALAATSTHHLFVAPSNSTAGTPGNNGDNGSGGMHEWSSLIGIVTALCGNVLISLALNIQRYAHIRIGREWEQKKSRNGMSGNDGMSVETRGRSRNRYRDSEQDTFAPYLDEEGDDTERRGGDSTSRDTSTGSKDTYNGNRKSYLKSPYWWVGIVLMVVGEMGNFMAYGFAPASIVSPLGVVALISNCIIAPCLLKEKFRKRDFWGAPSSEEQLGPHEIWENITRWEFELYLGLTTILIVGLMWASHRYGGRSILIDVGLVALFGGYTALSTKGVSTLLSGTLWHMITFPITYLLVFVLVFSALMQIRYINRALQRFDSTQVIPTQFVLFTLAVIVGSAVLYRDFESVTAVRATKFVGGCLLTFLGVYFITSGRVRVDDESSYSSEDEEGSIGLLNGDAYRDSIDLPPPRNQLPKSSNLYLEAQDDIPQSPSDSLLSRSIEGPADDETTPRGVLSAAPSSPHGSLTDESPLSAPSFDYTSPLRPPSRMSNPWADLHDQDITTANPDIRPVTPPGQEDDSAQASTVLLRFPPAPGIEETSEADGNADTSRRPSTPTLLNQATYPGRNEAPVESHPRHPLRNPISHRFSPGPLLPSISGGFSAVVADSIRRGDGSPLKPRTRRKLGRRRKLDGAFVESSNVDRTGDPSLSLAAARLQSATNQDDGPLETARDLATATGNDPTRNTDEEVTRLRSFSDSWNGGLAWLGGALRRAQNTQTADSVAATTTPTPNNEFQPEASGTSGGDAEAESEARR
ncbi:Magnesium transporter NIPA [Penicillium sp. DV-2018c]|nr:Magnesium transporter NIPA [Penicillium sp. DV-2018c]